MVIQNVTVNDCTPQTIVIGRRGTYDTMQIAFDLTNLVQTYGSGTAVLAVKRSQDESAYPAVTTQEDDLLLWTISETDTYYVGSGECQLMWYVDGGLAKTIIYPMVVMRDILSTTEEAPDAYQTWVDDLTALGVETLQNAQDAAQSASDAESAKDDAVTAKEAAEAALEEFTTPTASATSLAPEAQATAAYSSGHFTFGIPRGAQGATGATPDFEIGTVETLEPDQSATATITGTPENPVLNLGIPKGEKGEGGGGGGAVKSVNGKTGVVVLTASDVGAGTYSKPSGGIPKTDLAEAVQTSLGKADTALQTAPVSSVAGKTGAVTLDAGDAAFSDSETYAAGTVGAAITSQKNAIDQLDYRVTILEQGGVEEKTVSGGEVVTITDGLAGIKIGALTFNVDPSLTGEESVVVSHSGADVSNPETITVSWEDELGALHGGAITLHGDGTADIAETWAKVKVSDFRVQDIYQSPGYGAHIFHMKFYYIQDKKANGTTNVISDTFATSNAAIGSMPDMSMTGSHNNTYVYFRDDRCADETEFFNLNQNAVIVYELAVPKTAQITGLQELATYAGTNKFWTNAGDIESLTYYVRKSEIEIDPTLSIEGDAADAKATGDAVNAVNSKVEAIRTATDNDVGKALKVKTVSNGKVTEWEFGDADALGEAISLDDVGFYWIDANVESNLQKSNNGIGRCTMITLDAGDILRIASTEPNNDSNVRVYYAYDAVTGQRIDAPSKNYDDNYGVYFLKYDVDAHVYVNTKTANEYSVYLIPKTSPLSNIADLVGVSLPTVMDLNGAENISYALKSVKRRQYKATNTPTTFIHFSDIHGDGANLERIVEFANDPIVSSQVDDVICSGDVVFFSLVDGMTFYNDVEGSDAILVAIGNHDATIVSGGSNVPATPLETYTALMASNIGDWGVTQPANAAANGLCYYYKDYQENNLRVIFLDLSGHGDANYLPSELTWFAGILQSAYNDGLSVACVEHYPFMPNTYSYVPCSFSPRYNFNIADGAGAIPADFVDAVETFIGYGGEFVAWIAGHGHQDYVLLNNNGHQLCVGVSCATHVGYNIQYGDEIREELKKSQDLFNFITIDTASKNISIMRVGADLTRLMNSKKHLCLDYANRTVVWND